MPLNWQSHRFLREFSTFGVGGKIRFFTTITTEQEACEAFACIRQHSWPFFVLGRGSNCLFDDAGFEGAVLFNRMDAVEIVGEMVWAEGGSSFSLLGTQTARQGLSGLEFASGIPASVGGAVYMNAGAQGQETADCLVGVRYLDISGSLVAFSKEDLAFSYRTSSFQSMRGMILSASFRLVQSEDARRKQRLLLERRIHTQPLKEKSAGCVFRNPKENLSAGALIEQCGLKGICVGGIAVSEIHANFLVNRGQGTSAQTKALIQLIQEKVYRETGVLLEPEIKIVSAYG